MHPNLPTITIATSPNHEQSQCIRVTPTSSPVYRIEERRRTLYVSSDVHPTAWSADTVANILKLADVPEVDSLLSSSNVRRTRSLENRGIYVVQDALASVYPRPTTTYRSRRTSLATDAIFTKPPARDRVLFYHRHDPHYGFTNFSPHPVNYDGKLYPTSEHLFQSFKFQGHRPGLAEHIRTCSERPSVAFSQARRFQPEVRKDWKQVNIQKMDETLWYKFTQHHDLKEELLATGDAELVEDSDKDAFWGVGADGKGRNELGKALERLRSVLRATW